MEMSGLANKYYPNSWCDVTVTSLEMVKSVTITTLKKTFIHLIVILKWPSFDYSAGKSDGDSYVTGICWLNCEGIMRWPLHCNESSFEMTLKSLWPLLYEKSSITSLWHYLGTRHNVNVIIIWPVCHNGFHSGISKWQSHENY